MAIFNSYIWHRKVYFVISIILMMIASIAEPVHWKAKNGTLLKRSLCFTIWMCPNFSLFALTFPFWMIKSNSFLLTLPICSLINPDLLLVDFKLLIYVQHPSVLTISVFLLHVMARVALTGATGSMFGNRMDIDINLLWNLSCKDQKNNSRVHIKQTHTPQIRL